ncbi:MAG TPA: tripartite tricarboxylate transporter substrate binding protein [Burkholderiales bacterium]|nr:tripartite tricarboxylate transporter substrate binding protein [Burkholderiales bacterium]
MKRSLLIAAAALAFCAPAHGQYPDKPVRIVVPYTPAGPTDILARLLGDGFRTRLGATVVIENKPGAGGNLGHDVVAKSAPDGYTLLLGYVGPLAINPSLYGGKLPYKPLEDFTPISQLVSTALVAVVHPGLPAKNMDDLVRHAKASKGGITYASGGAGSANHMAGELFRLATGAELVHVPYKGIAPATMDVVGGQVTLMFNGLSVAIPHIRSGKLRALAVTSGERVPSLPDVPTMQEAGFNGFDVSAWFGLLAPARLPAEILDRLERATNEIMRTPEAVARVEALGMVARPSTSKAFARYIREENERWAKVVQASGAKPD